MTTKVKFVPEDLTEWNTMARRDDWHRKFVASDIRCMLAEIARLRVELEKAQVDALELHLLVSGEGDQREA